jgi:dihydroorotase
MTSVSEILSLPALVDVHVHLRQPGQEHKETIATGTRAARAGGFGLVCCMPNTIPVLDTPELVTSVLEIARREGSCQVAPIACITKGQLGNELTDFAALKAAGACGLSDDGHSVESESLMRQALINAYELGLTVASHCEPETQIAQREIRLAQESGTRVHVCHVSKKETVAAIRSAKEQGVAVTAETCPHYFLSQAKGTMNPPLGDEEDRAAVIQGLLDSTIDCIVTDHAPHTTLEKQQNPNLNGVIGLETALAATLTALVIPNLISVSRLIELMRTRPAQIYSLTPPSGTFQVDLSQSYIVQPPFASKSENTPFLGVELFGKIVRWESENG